MFCCIGRGFFKRCFRKKEPLRDVSFIINAKERTILTDAINAVNSVDNGWELVRNGELSSVTASMNLTLHTEDSLDSTVAIVSHIAYASNWDDWAQRRSIRQTTDEKNKRSLDMWIRSHQYTANTNNFILFSYLENLLRYIDGWSDVDKQGSGADDLIYAIESVIGKIDTESFQGDEYKVEVFRKVVSINIPSDYELTKALMDKHIDYIKTYDEKQDDINKLYEFQLHVLRFAITGTDLVYLQGCMRGPNIIKKLKTSPEYLVAIELEQKLLC